ncbi:MAG TPA: SOUL heme-binding protein [Lentisphaeria bacterium]|nr:SOUL heme-binding protein [Lentisphaeria bacterium]
MNIFRSSLNRTRKPRLRRVHLAVLGAVAAVAGGSGCIATRGNYQTASFQQGDSEGAFSVRHYEPMTVVSTTAGVSPGSGDGSFRRLFRYISGANGPGQKVAMTTPVFMDQDQGRQRMSFVLPDEHADAPPTPSDSEVRLRRVEAHAAAVVTFSGRANGAEVARRTASLREWMKRKQLVSSGPAVVAQYDPPWTPGPLRRNEVLIPIVPPAPL